MNTYDYIWAKQDGIDQPYPLLAHLLDAATVAGALYQHWLRQGLRDLLEEALGPDSKRIVMWLAATHDIGKASPIFQYQPRQKGEAWDFIRQSYADDAVTCSFGNLEDLLAQYEFSRGAENSFLRRHEQMSALAIYGGFLPESQDYASEEWVALSAMGHHGTFRLPAFGGSASEKKARKILKDLGWQQAQQDLISLVSQTLCVDSEDFPEEVSPTVTILLSGLVILADRMASGADWVKENQQRLSNGAISLTAPAEWLATLAAPAVQRIDNLLGIYRGWSNQDAALAAILGKHTPRPLQEQALHTGAGLWNAMAPTGNGKTEAAALRHSLEEERLIFLLPTQATSNALMRRIQKMYTGTPNVAALAHGLASIEDFYTQPVTDYSDTCEGKDNGGLYPTEFVRSGASRLLAPVCVGTVDQSLMAAIPLKWTHLRLLALANAHVVIDEVHTLDHYQSELLVPLLKWWGQTNTRVTFLSATFPSWQRARFLNAYSGKEITTEPVFPAAESIAFGQAEPLQLALSAPGSAETAENSYTIDFTFDEPIFDQLAQTHIAWVSAQRERFPLARLGVICNTVARAQEVARALSAKGEQVVLLHSRMTAEHRRLNAELLERLIGSGGSGVSLTVVGTQAIEASLDIDLDMLSTDLCPAPSLIQRAGRVWRRKDAARADRVPGLENLPINVLKPAQPEKYQLLPYTQAELEKTWKFLRTHQQFVCPSDNQAFVDAAAVTLETIGLDLDVMDAELDHLALDSIKIQRGKQLADHLQQAIRDKSSLADFMAFTDPTLRDSGDAAFTRLIDADVRQVILGGAPSQVPGGWGGTYEELLALSSFEQEKIRRALKASMPVAVNAATKELLDNARPLADAKSLLKRYVFLPIPEGIVYDPVLGFTGETS